MLAASVLLLGAALAAPGARVYIIANQDGPAQKRAIDCLFLVDQTTGGSTKIAEDFVYYGESDIRVGISAYDEAGHRFFYVTDYATRNIYSVNTTTGALFAPIDLYSTTIKAMAYDQKHRELIVFDQGKDQNGKTGTRLFRISDGDVLQNSLGALQVDTATVDSVARTVIAINYDGKEVAVVPLSDPQKVKKYALVGCHDVVRFVFSKEHTLFAISPGTKGGKPAATYSKVVISGNTANCTAPSVFVEGGYLAAFYNNEASGEVWFTYGSQTSGSLFGVLDLETGNTTSKLFNPFQMPSDIAVSYFN